MSHLQTLLNEYWLFYNVFIKAFKFGLMCLELKKPTDPNEDAYFKDFLDILDSDAAVSEKLHSFFNLYLLLLTLMASPAAAFNSTTILVVDAFFTSCLWQLKMLLWWLSCFKCFMFFLMLLMGLPAAAAKSAFLAVKCSCRCFLFLLLIMELVCCKGCF